MCCGDDGSIMCRFGMLVKIVLLVLLWCFGVWMLLFYGMCSIIG